MNDSTISVRYARALFESALEKNLLDEIRKDMGLMQEICRVSEFEFLLRSPMLNESQKSRVIGNLVEKRVNPLTISLINLVVKNGRELYIPGIARNFNNLYMQHRGIKPARLVSAGPLEQELQQKIVDTVKKTLGTEVELETIVDEDIIGGFIMRIEDQQYDASLATSLKKVKQQLLKS